MEDSKPTIVLVHGALTDASVWAAVIAQLQLQNYRVLAPALPMRGLHSDTDYLDSFLASIKGSVVLVGHSYAGSVISSQPRRAGQIRALVYVSAFQPDTNESAGELNERFPGSKLGPDTLAFLPTPTGTDLYLKTECFHEVYAGDLSAATVAIMAATQRPVDSTAMEETLQGQPAWRNIPSWAVVTTDDLSIPPAAQRFMAARAQSTVREVKASHAVPVSHPHEVVNCIVEAASAR
ncbi:alpha/beta fold hydrolase [Trinickia acidisoli]|uniref:alpha/beta fold hydrolase n=1 Tax=Trinickia acidisoli TaxID=2767482 RepID=UPI001A8D3D3F|nr:alpha/beta hydrolase [Trinickia acidisoli]